MLFDSNGNKLSQAKPGKGWENNGVLDALCVTKQICLTDWETMAQNMPKTSSTYYEEDEKTKGMPYSSASFEDGYIGLSISLYTYMSAVHNPRSVLYTLRSKGYTGVAYYGTVCTSLICAAWGLPCLYTTAALPKCDFITPVSFADMELGDMMLNAGHARLITGLKRDANGVITHVQTSESVTPHCRQNDYESYSSFVSRNSDYTMYRYEKINEVNSYEPSPFIALLDEIGTSVVFPDIMTCFGDKVTRKYGENVTINVLDNTGYTKIEIYRDGILIDTKTSLVDFVLTAPIAGLYECRMIGDKKTSSTYFDIVDCTISIDDDTATFETTYLATAIGGFPVYSVDGSGNATSWNNPKRNRIITEEENVNREIDITEFINDSDCQGGIRLYVKGAYGTVSFEKKYN